GSDGVLEVQEHDVGDGLRGLFEQLRLASGHRQLAAVEARRRRLDDLEAHGSLRWVSAAFMARVPADDKVSPRPAQAGGDAVDREQQRHEVFAGVAAGTAGADAAEQLYLLAAGAVEHGKAAVEAAAVVGKAVEQRLLAGEAQEVDNGAAVFGLDHAVDLVTHLRVWHQIREAAGDGEIDERQGLLDFVDDQAEEREGIEHA